MSLLSDLREAVAAGVTCKKNLMELKRILREESVHEENQTLFLAELDLIEKNLEKILGILKQYGDRKISRVTPIDQPKVGINIYDETERILDSFYERLNVVVIDLEIKLNNLRDQRRSDEVMIRTMLQSGNIGQIAYLLTVVNDLRTISKEL